MKNNPQNYPKWALGSASIMASFGAKGFNSGYGGVERRYREGKEGRTKYSGSLINLKKQIPYLTGIVFTSMDYRELDIKDKSLVYCDPPYRNTAQYGNFQFNFEEYDNWIRELSKRCYVFCSEYSMPEDFICIKEMPKYNIMRADSNSERIIDRLFIYKDGLLQIESEVKNDNKS